MTKSEKRHFRLYASRNESGETSKFLKLFDVVDKLSVCTDDIVISKLNGVNKSQYSNLKRHLYSQILTSLRLVQKSKRSNIRVREYIDFAHILYGKGLYLQALKVLQLAKNEAQKHQLNFMHLTIVELEKVIETRHITRSGEKRAMSLVEESRQLTSRIDDVVFLSNLRTELHGLYIKFGHNRDKTSQESLKQFFKSQIDQINEAALGVLEMVYMQQSFVWYYHIQLDFRSCLLHARQWVQLFVKNPEMIHRDVDLYMRGYHYILTSCFHLKDIDALTTYLSEFEAFRKLHYYKFNNNSQIISFLYVHTGRLNKIILEGNFEEGLAYIPRTLRRLHRYQDKLDNHRVLVFYYKIAWIYFGAGDTRKAIEYLHKIVNQELSDLREDLQIYARLLFLICHYESGEYNTYPYLIKSFKPFFDRIKEDFPLQTISYKLLKELNTKPLGEHTTVMKQYLNELDKLKEDPFRTVSFTYLDVTIWLRARIYKKTFQDILKQDQSSRSTMSN